MLASSPKTRKDRQDGHLGLFAWNDVDTSVEKMKELTESAEGAIEDAAIQAATDANDAVAVSIDDLVGDP